MFDARVFVPSLRSFCADASYFLAPVGGDGFDPIPYPPLFAVEVRQWNDYGPRVEQQRVQKRHDYLAAGTLVVWDVDLQDEEVVAKYTRDNPDAPQIFKRGDEADAEPAVPGWKIPVNALFAPVRAAR